MKKIGIVSWHYYRNFGSALQSYALQHVITQLGYKAEIVNYRNPRFGTYNYIKTDIKALITEWRKIFPKIVSQSYPFEEFWHNCMHESRCIQNDDEMEAFIERQRYDAIVYGSDQIWAPNAFNPIYMGRYVDASKTKKISYAASIGLMQIPKDLAVQYSKNLSDFYAVSIREETGRELLNRECGISSKVVLDPTLLVKRIEYDALAKPVEDVPASYGFCYFLNGNNNYRSSLLEYAKKHGLTLCGVSANEKDYEWIRPLRNIGPREFLWLINNAKHVFTDSYHGTIFSMIYHKRFNTFERFSANSPINQNSRIDQLIRWFGVSNQIVRQGEIISEFEFDYDEFEKRLESARMQSLLFLKEALQ